MEYREYKSAVGWKLFALIGGTLLCFLFGWLAYITIYAEPFSLTLALILLPISIGMIVMFIYGIIDMFISKLIITKGGIKKVNLLGTRKLSFDQVKGIRSDQNYVYIIPHNKTQKGIKVSQYFGKKSEWLGFLNSRFKDIDFEHYLEEEKKLHKDQAFGSTKKERSKNISRVKQLTRFLNGISLVAGLWYIFIANPYSLVTAINLILPIVGIFILYRENGRIKLFKDDNSPYPSISITFLIPLVALMIRGILDFDILDYTNAWVYVFLITPIVLIILVRIGKSEFKGESKIDTLIIYPVLIAFIGVYVFFGSVLINCTYDNSTPLRFESTVLKKRISDGKNSTRYLLTITPWEGVEEDTEVSLPKSKYESLEANDKIIVYQQKGLLNIPWFYVKKY